MASWAASKTPGSLQKQSCYLSEELVNEEQLLCAASFDNYDAETWTLTKQAQNKLAAAQTKLERRMLNITYSVQGQKDQHLSRVLYIKCNAIYDNLRNTGIIAPNDRRPSISLL